MEVVQECSVVDVSFSQDVTGAVFVIVPVVDEVCSIVHVEVAVPVVDVVCAVVHVDMAVPVVDVVCRVVLVEVAVPVVDVVCRVVPVEVAVVVGGAVNVEVVVDVAMVGADVLPAVSLVDVLVGMAVEVAVVTAASIAADGDAVEFPRVELSAETHTVSGTTWGMSGFGWSPPVVSGLVMLSTVKL